MLKKWKPLLIIAAVFLGVVLFFQACSIMINGYWYITEDISDYGQIKGNKDDAEVRGFLMSYFPQEIEPWFEQVEFSYKANNQCSYKAEMHLDFTISDPVQFQNCVEELTAGLTAQSFPYDDQVDDYIIHNHLYVEPSSGSKTGEEKYYFRFGARMGRILIYKEEQRIICEGILVSGCCGGYAHEFDFYTHYGIDPQEYSDRFCGEDEYELPGRSGKNALLFYVKGKIMKLQKTF